MQIQKGLKARAVAGLVEMGQLVEDHILHALPGLPGQHQRKPQLSGPRIAAAPAGLHVPDLKA